MGKAATVVLVAVAAVVAFLLYRSRLRSSGSSWSTLPVQPVGNPTAALPPSTGITAPPVAPGMAPPLPQPLLVNRPETVAKLERSTPFVSRMSGALVVAPNGTVSRL